MTKVDLFTDPSDYDGKADEIMSFVGEEEYKAWLTHPVTKAMLLRFKAEAVRGTINILEGNCPKEDIDLIRGRVVAMSLMSLAMTQEEFN